jgi:hypothetical protein
LLETFRENPDLPGGAKAISGVVTAAGELKVLDGRADHAGRSGHGGQGDPFANPSRRLSPAGHRSSHAEIVGEPFDVLADSAGAMGSIRSLHARDDQPGSVQRCCSMAAA